MSASDADTLRLLTNRDTFTQLDPSAKAFVLGAVRQLDVAIGRNTLILSCVFAIVLSDAVWSLPAERREIWSARRSWGKYLYIYTRYMFLITECCYVAMMYGAWSPSSCYKNRFLIPIMPVFVVPFSQLLLALRAWALWERARWVIVVVAFPWMFTLASHIYTITMVKSVAPMLRDTGPCLLITSGDLGLNLVLLEISYAAYDLVVSSLILYQTYKLWSSQRSLGLSGLPTLLMRDSCIYWVSLIILYIIHICYTYLQQEPERKADLAWVSATLQILMTLRITLNLHSEERFMRDLDTETFGGTANWGLSKTHTGMLEMHAIYRSPNNLAP